MRSTIGNPTKADRERFLAFRSIGCVACYLQKRFADADVHHLLSGGRRRGHRFTVPLCPPHHRGIGFVEALHGSSLATSPKTFRSLFGADETLLALTDQLVARQLARRVGAPHALCITRSS